MFFQHKKQCYKTNEMIF